VKNFETGLPGSFFLRQKGKISEHKRPHNGTISLTTIFVSTLQFIVILRIIIIIGVWLDAAMEENIEQVFYPPLRLGR